MTDKDHHPLVPVSPGSLARTTDGPHGVIARMASDVLEIVRAKDLALEQARYRIGDYEFRGADYRQILRWAEALGCTPRDVVEILAGKRFESTYGVSVVDFSVVDGYISSLVWDFAELPLDRFTWEDGLRIHTLAFQSIPPAGGLPGTFPSGLHKLCCESMDLKKLDLSGVPELKLLDCYGNELAELDLSGVPGLMELICSGNQLAELDLSDVSALTALSCWENQLVDLDLSGVPRLTFLDCSRNLLTELNLSDVPKLTWLSCVDNPLIEIDLSVVPRLKNLNFWSNQLTAVDLSGVPKLTWLSCGDNQLSELDLSNVPGLTELYCGQNQLTELDIRPLRNLESLWVDASVRIIGTPPKGCQVKKVKPPRGSSSTPRPAV